MDSVMSKRNSAPLPSPPQQSYKEARQLKRVLTVKRSRGITNAQGLRKASLSKWRFTLPLKDEQEWSQRRREEALTDRGLVTRALGEGGKAERGAEQSAAVRGCVPFPTCRLQSERAAPLSCPEGDTEVQPISTPLTGLISC